MRTAIPPRIIIINPYLKNKSGHHFNYTKNLADVAKKDGIECLIFGNVEATDEVQQLEKCYPYFNTPPTFILQHSLSFSVIFKFIFSCFDFLKKIKSLYKAYGNLYNTTIFFHSPYIFEALVMSLFIYFNYKSIKRYNNHFFIGYNFDFPKPNKIIAFMLKIFYKIAAYLSRPQSGYVTLFSDGTYLADYYQKIVGYPLAILPVSIRFPDDCVINLSPKNIDNICYVSFLGGSRWNKGFDLLPDIIETFNFKNRQCNVQFQIQIDCHEAQQGEQKRIINNAITKIKVISNKFNNIFLIEASLSPEMFYQKILQSHIILMPYRPESFLYAPSQIFQESIIAGALPIVSKNTCMSKELIQNGLSDLTCDLDPKIFAETIITTIQNYNVLQEKSIPLRKRYYETFTPIKILEEIKKRVLLQNSLT